MKPYSFALRAACNHHTFRIDPALPDARECSMHKTGVTPIPALRSTTGRVPGRNTKLPRGALVSLMSPVFGASATYLLPAPVSLFTLMRYVPPSEEPEIE